MSREMKRLAMKVSRELVTQRVDLGDDSYDVIVGTGATCPPRARHSGLSTREMSTSCSVIVARRCPLPPRASARKRIRLRVQRFPLMLKTTTHSIWDQRQAGSR